MTATERQVKDMLTCMRCGYSLYGLPIGGDCPECGEEIAPSASTAYGFTKRELIVVASRLLAIWLLALAIVGLVTIGMALLGLYLEGSQTIFIRQAFMQSGANVVAPLLLAMLAWFGAHRLSKWMVRRDGLASAGTLSQAYWLNVGLVLLGVYFVAIGSEDVMKGFLYLAQAEGMRADYFLAGGGTYLGIGAACIVFGARRSGPIKRIRRILRRLRTAGA